MRGTRLCLRGAGLLQLLAGAFIGGATQLAAADEVITEALVKDPPSNVRSSPTGAVVCSINERKKVNVFAKALHNGRSDEWLLTDACAPKDQPGSVWGVIHRSQLSNFDGPMPSFTVTAEPFIRCANSPDRAPEECVVEHSID